MGGIAITGGSNTLYQLGQGSNISFNLLSSAKIGSITSIKSGYDHMAVLASSTLYT